MYRAVPSVMILSLILAGFVPAQDKKSDDLMKSIDLGALGEHFKLLSAEWDFDPQRGGTVVLKLEAKKDIDTSRLYFKVGFFDKSNHLHATNPLRFMAAFPLQKGESIRVDTLDERGAGDGSDPQNWHRIVIRKIDNPTKPSEYHYQ